MFYNTLTELLAYNFELLCQICWLDEFYMIDYFWEFEGYVKRSKNREREEYVSSNLIDLIHFNDNCQWYVCSHLLEAGQNNPYQTGRHFFMAQETLKSKETELTSEQTETRTLKVEVLSRTFVVLD